jgi:hypothetical protein
LLSKVRSQSKLGFNLPGPFGNIILIKVLIRVVPPHHIQTRVIVKHIVREGSYFRQITVSFHQVVLDIELETLLRSHCFVKPSEYQDRLTIDRHAHGQVASSPSALCMQVDKSPHVEVDVVHFDSISDLLLVKFGPP